MAQPQQLKYQIVPQAPATDKPGFWQGVRNGLAKADGERFICALPKVIVLLGSTTAVTWLLWLQSVVLYKASGFAEPELIATGGILMVIGFAAYYSVSRSWLALLLCMYAGAYETYFIASGTIVDEKQTKTEAISSTPEAEWHKEQVARAKSEYERQKERFDNPDSREYQSTWFKKNYVDQAWEKYSVVQEKQSRYLRGIEWGAEFDHVGCLKIFYRLGLIFLFMLLVHKMIAFLPTKLTNE